MDQNNCQPPGRFKRAIKRTFGLLKKDKDNNLISDSDLPNSERDETLAMASDGVKSYDRNDANTPAAERLLPEGVNEEHDSDDQHDLSRHSVDDFDDFERLFCTTIDTAKAEHYPARERKDCHTSDGQASDYDLTLSHMWEFSRRSAEHRREFYERVGDNNLPAGANLVFRPRLGADSEVECEGMNKPDIKREGEREAGMDMPKINVPPPVALAPAARPASSRPPWLRGAAMTGSYAPYRPMQPMPPMTARHPLPPLPPTTMGTTAREEAPIVVYNNAPLFKPKPIRPGPIAARWTNEVIERTERELKEKEERLAAAEKDAVDAPEDEAAYAEIRAWQKKQVEEAAEEEK